MIGGAGALFGGESMADMQVLGLPVGGAELVVGPVTHRNFPWVLLARALWHHRLVCERNHARRDALIVDSGDAGHFADAIDSTARRKLEALFVRLRELGDHIWENSAWRSKN